VTKRHWGAFHGTDLDLLLRRRGVRTIVLAGIATNIGVESTARSAHEHGYDLVVVEDATTGNSAEMHAFAFERIFPRVARIAKTAQIQLGAG
jgi:nicotinamidase-related amidase